MTNAIAQSDTGCAVQSKVQSKVQPGRIDLWTLSYWQADVIQKALDQYADYCIRSARRSGKHQDLSDIWQARAVLTIELATQLRKDVLAN